MISFITVYQIKTPNRIEAEEEWDKQEEINAQDPDYQKAKLESKMRNTNNFFRRRTL